VYEHSIRWDDSDDSAFRKLGGSVAEDRSVVVESNEQLLMLHQIRRDPGSMLYE